MHHIIIIACALVACTVSVCSIHFCSVSSFVFWNDIEPDDRREWPRGRESAEWFVTEAYGLSAWKEGWTRNRRSTAGGSDPHQRTLYRSANERAEWRQRPIRFAGRPECQKPRSERRPDRRAGRSSQGERSHHSRSRSSAWRWDPTQNNTGSKGFYSLSDWRRILPAFFFLLIKDNILLLCPGWAAGATITVYA